MMGLSVKTCVGIHLILLVGVASSGCAPRQAHSFTAQPHHTSVNEAQGDNMPPSEKRKRTPEVRMDVQRDRIVEIDNSTSGEKRDRKPEVLMDVQRDRIIRAPQERNVSTDEVCDPSTPND